MNEAKYSKILGENLLRSAKDLRLWRRFMFQQDNNPKHRLNNNNVKVHEWPSQSRDLNPIENLWKDFKIAVHRHSPSNLTELEQICKEEWQKLPKSS